MQSKLLQVIHRAGDIAVLGHVQVGVDLHGGADAGMADRLRKCGQVKIGIVLVLDVVVRHIGMPQAVHGDFVG